MLTLCASLSVYAHPRFFGFGYEFPFRRMGAVREITDVNWSALSSGAGLSYLLQVATMV